jgi:hypothetical protein
VLTVLPNHDTEETHRRAQETARLVGETMTGAGRPRKLRNRADLVERMLKIGRGCTALPVLDRRKPEDMLYDKNGLPERS